MDVYGWGRFPRVDATVEVPQDSDAARKILQSKRQVASIPRGAGRSYGDSALAAQILSSHYLDSFMEFDSAEGSIHCGAGTTLATIIQVCLPAGWFPVVVPGTAQVSIGGAIAADVHGKNHHIDGSFCNHVSGFNLMLADGSVEYCSPEENTELFHATCGGMGLTGSILDARIALRKVSSATIKQRTLIAEDLAAALKMLSENSESTYSVAWLDCLARGENLGRSVVFLGEHDTEVGDLKTPLSKGPSVPLDMPRFLLNRFTLGSFNSLYYQLHKMGKSQSNLRIDKFFFPLDRIHNWNRLYGSRGFLQYQFVLPTDTAQDGIQAILDKVSAAGKGSFLAVLKKFGPANENLLTFPMPGYTLTLDFKWQEDLFPLLDELDQMVIQHGGRHYLAKDARLQETVFKQTYSNWEKFKTIKDKVDPNGKFTSLQSQRLGLSEAI